MSDISSSPSLDSPESLRAASLQGLRDGFGVPAIAIFSSMAGFAAIAREAGFDLSQSVMTTALVWGLPGQVAMASLYLAGSSALVIFTAVALANFRMMLMVTSTMEILGLKQTSMGFMRKFFLMHFLAITTWVQLGHVQMNYTPPQLLRYYKTFVVMIYGAGLTGTILGYFLSDVVPIKVVQVVLVLTPLYILMMVINARLKANRYAVVVGGVLCPLCYPLMGEWAILFGGIFGGTLVLLATYKQSKDGSDAQ